MTAAGVVVANPVIPPRSDVQIPAVQLSAGTGDALAMLDEDFLKAIAPEPPESTNPFAIIKDLITSLAADATYLGKNAIVDAFVAGATAVTQPELTAASLPYVPYVPPFQPSAGPVVPAPAPPFVTPLPLDEFLPVDLTVSTGELPDLTPVLAEVVTAVVNDVSYVSNQLITAAFATGVMLAREPLLIVDTLRSLIEGDVRGALTSAVQAVVAPFGPPRIIIDAIRTVVEQYLPVPVVVIPPVPAESPAETPVQAPAPGASVDVIESDTPTTDLVESDAPERRRLAVETVVELSQPTTGDTVPEVADVQEPTEVAAPAEPVVEPVVNPPRRAGRAGPVGQAVAEVADQVQSALRDAGDAVRKAATRAPRSAPGPGGE